MERQEFIDEADLIRGQFLTRWILLENLIVVFLSKYFCSHKNDILLEFEAFLYESKNFNAKLSTFKKLARKYFDNQEETEKVISNIEKYLKMRNLFAHAIIDVSDNRFNNNVLCFMNMGNYNEKGVPQKVGEYDKGKHLEILKDMADIKGMLIGVFNQMDKQN
jgi:hypothetical protein